MNNKQIMNKIVKINKNKSHRKNNINKKVIY